MDRQEIIDLVHSTRDLVLDKRKAQEVTVKGAADFVTSVDLAVQNYLQQELGKRTPDVLLLAEEKKNQVPDPKKSYWILDPIDGTTNLIHDYQMSAVSLGFYECPEGSDQGRVTVGVVYNPFTEETFSAQLGGGAYLNGQPIQVSHRALPEDCIISFGSCPYEKGLATKLFPIFERIFTRTADFRRSGSAAMDLCHVAAGRVDGYFEWNLKPWDYAAGHLIVQEAGGVAMKWDGTKLPILKNSDLLACTPEIYEFLKESLEENT